MSIDGQKISIRPVSLEIESDIERMYTISRSKKIHRWMDELSELTYDDIEEWIEDSEYSSDPENNDEWWEITFAVTCSAELVDPSEVGKMQGFINFYTDDEVQARFERHAQELHIEVPEGSVIVEVSMGKWLKAPKKIMSEGLNQATQAITEIKNDKPLVLVGYIDPENIRSIKSFERAHFINRGLVYYDLDDDLDSLEEDGVFLFICDQK